VRSNCLAVSSQKPGSGLETVVHGLPCPLGQVGHSFKTLGSQRVADRIGRRTIVLVPLARPPMQDGNQLGLLCHQMGLEHIGKEVMVAIPLALVVEWNDE
jgi:hypothetical protein